MCGTVSSLAYSTAQPCVLSLRCYRVSRRNGRAPLRRRASAPSSHSLPRFSFTNPKHRFGFDRKNEEADMEFSAFAGNGMQRVHSDAGKKWGNRLDLRCATCCDVPLISRLRRQLPPEGEALGGCVTRPSSPRRRLDLRPGKEACQCRSIPCRKRCGMTLRCHSDASVKV